MIDVFDSNLEITEFAFTDINPVIFAGLHPKVRQCQKLFRFLRIISIHMRIIKGLCINN
jgi:hypothetical protein